MTELTSFALSWKSNNNLLWHEIEQLTIWHTSIIYPFAIFHPVIVVIPPVPEPLGGQDEVRGFCNRWCCGQSTYQRPFACHWDKIDQLMSGAGRSNAATFRTGWNNFQNIQMKYTVHNHKQYVRTSFPWPGYRILFQPHVRLPSRSTCHLLVKSAIYRVDGGECERTCLPERIKDGYDKQLKYFAKHEGLGCERGSRERYYLWNYIRSASNRDRFRFDRLHWRSCRICVWCVLSRLVGLYCKWTEY